MLGELKNWWTTIRLVAGRGGSAIAIQGLARFGAALGRPRPSEIGSLELEPMTFRVPCPGLRFERIIEDENFNVEDWLRRSVARRLNRYRRKPLPVSPVGEHLPPPGLKFSWPVASLFPFGTRGEFGLRFPVLLRPQGIRIDVVDSAAWTGSEIGGVQC